jgi:hypothetical protein
MKGRKDAFGVHPTQVVNILLRKWFSVDLICTLPESGDEEDPNEEIDARGIG